jgi:hypothetical protein
VATEQTSVEDVRRLLDAGAEDEAACDAYARMLTSLNGPGQAMMRVAVSGLICALRPHRAETVLAFPVQICLEHGARCAVDVIHWGQAIAQDHYLAKMAGPDGVLWLREGLPGLEAMIGRLLWEAWALCRMYTGRCPPPPMEDEWAACQDAERMVWHLEACGLLSGRKRALFAAEVCRAAARVFRSPEELREVLELLERRAEAGPHSGRSSRPVDLNWGGISEADDLRVLAPLVRDLFGNPFRPAVIVPSCLNTAVLAIARGVYEERAFDQLSILADALEDAGCDNAEILTHCRRPGQHVRGCWVVDLILSNE